MAFTSENMSESLSEMGLKLFHEDILLSRRIQLSTKSICVCKLYILLSTMYSGMCVCLFVQSNLAILLNIELKL